MCAGRFGLQRFFTIFPEGCLQTIGEDAMPLFTSQLAVLISSPNCRCQLASKYHRADACCMKTLTGLIQDVIKLPRGAFTRAQAWRIGLKDIPTAGPAITGNRVGGQSFETSCAALGTVPGPQPHIAHEGNLLPDNGLPVVVHLRGQPHCNYTQSTLRCKGGSSESESCGFR